MSEKIFTIEEVKLLSKNKYYCLEVKHSAVNDYISGKGSLYDICIIIVIINGNLIILRRIRLWLKVEK